ncbi:MAG TPA: DUF454 family protein [Acidimicrobiia bacterium]
MTQPEPPRLIRSPIVRLAAVVGGLVLTSLGIAGIVLPGLPGTPLLLLAAWLFSLSNERLYRWIVGNRWFGQAIADYRAGLGIPRRAKTVAVSMVVVVVGFSVAVGLDRMWSRVAVAGLGVYGVYFILTRPTREAIGPLSSD